MNEEENTEERCIECGHRRTDHSLFIDNMIASTTYKPERRHCLHQNGAGQEDCKCVTFVSAAKRMTGPGRVHVPSQVKSIPEFSNIDPEKIVQELPKPDRVGLFGPDVDERYQDDYEYEDEEPVSEEEYGSPALEHDQVIVAIRTDPVCDTCLNSKYPGILWPANYHTGTAWIQRCDECCFFVDDLSAAYFLSAVTGVPLQLGQYEGGATFFTPIPDRLVQSISRALRIG